MFKRVECTNKTGTRSPMSQWSLHTDCRCYVTSNSSDLSPALLHMWYMPVCVHTEAKGSMLGALLYWPSSCSQSFSHVHVFVGDACGGWQRGHWIPWSWSCELSAENQTSDFKTTASTLNCWTTSAAPSLTESRGHPQRLASKPQGLPHLCPSSRCHPGFLCGHWSSGSTLPSPWIFSKLVIGRGRAGCPYQFDNPILKSFKLCVHV